MKLHQSLDLDDWTLYNVKTAQKTNAARLLDRMGIHYELREYDVDPDDLAAETVAAKIGLPPEQVFKTLVARGDHSKDRSKDRGKDRSGICMAVIPGDQELNLKALAAAAGERKIQLVPVKELQALTGYIRGGVTALAAKRDFPVYDGRDHRAVRRSFHLGRSSRIADPNRARRLSARNQRPASGARTAQGWIAEARVNYFGELRKSSTLHLILGGAALQCVRENRFLANPVERRARASSPGGAN